jgi:hypothetical protein
MERHGEDRLQELVSTLTDRCVCLPPVQFLGAPIPVGDDVAHITDENGVVREIEEAGLLGALRHLALELVAGLPQLVLDPAASGAEGGDHEREQEKDDEDRAIRRFDVERVQGECEEVVESQT